MPYYTFRHGVTGETIDVFQRMQDSHYYIDSQGVEWERVWVKPQMSVDTKIDPFSAQDFVKKTSNTKGKLGDMFDRSKELSLKREEKMGKDPLKEKYYENYSKTRKKNVEHPDVKRAKLKTELSKKGVDIDF